MQILPPGAAMADLPPPWLPSARQYELHVVGSWPASRVTVDGNAVGQRQHKGAASALPTLRCRSRSCTDTFPVGATAGPTMGPP